MVEALDRGARHREGVGLSAEPLSTLPERDLMPLLRQAQGGGQPGDTATDDGDASPESEVGSREMQRLSPRLKSRIVRRLASHS